jgi:hypothetical protein
MCAHPKRCARARSRRGEPATRGAADSAARASALTVCAAVQLRRSGAWAAAGGRQCHIHQEFVFEQWWLLTWTCPRGSCRLAQRVIAHEMRRSMTRSSLKVTTRHVCVWRLPRRIALAGTCRRNVLLHCCAAARLDAASAAQMHTRSAQLAGLEHARKESKTCVRPRKPAVMRMPHAAAAQHGQQRTLEAHTARSRRQGRAQQAASIVGQNCSALKGSAPP